MLEVWARLSSDRGRAVMGTLVLHSVVVAGLFITWRPPVGNAPPEPIPVVLIELPARVEPPAETPPDPPPDTDPEPEPEPEAEPVTPEISEAEVRPEPDTPDEKLPEDEPEGENQTASGAIVAQAGVETDRPETPLQPEIDPRFKVEFDPFAEIAPSGLARVSRAVNCARVNRDTRPAFCPDYDEEDLQLAGLNREKNVFRTSNTYDPVYDIAGARSTLERFSGRQVIRRPNGQSEVARTSLTDPVVPDKDCQLVRLENGYQLDAGTAIPGLAAVYCD